MGMHNLDTSRYRAISLLKILMTRTETLWCADLYVESSGRTECIYLGISEELNSLLHSFARGAFCGSWVEVWWWYHPKPSSVQNGLISFVSVREIL